jgi:hypothetical protein
MSAVLTELGGAAFAAYSNVLTLVPQGQFVPATGSPITIDATIEEQATDTLEVTDLPVEAGANIGDHSFVKPANLIMRCGWSNANSSSLINTVSSLFSSGSSQIGSDSSPTISGGSMSVSDYVSGVYSQLLALQQSLLPFTVITSIRQYTNMMLLSISLTRDQKTSQALMVTATMKQIIIVNTQSAVLPPTANQATPANTAETTNLGPQNLQSGATPAPGGSAPPNGWPPGSDEAAGIFTPDEILN